MASQSYQPIPNSTAADTNIVSSPLGLPPNGNTPQNNTIFDEQPMTTALSVPPSANARDPAETPNSIFAPSDSSDIEMTLRSSNIDHHLHRQQHLSYSPPPPPPQAQELRHTAHPFAVGGGGGGGGGTGLQLEADDDDDEGPLGSLAHHSLAPPSVTSTPCTTEAAHVRIPNDDEEAAVAVGSAVTPSISIAGRREKGRRSRSVAAATPSTGHLAMVGPPHHSSIHTNNNTTAQQNNATAAVALPVPIGGGASYHRGTATDVGSTIASVLSNGAVVTAASNSRAHHRRHDEEGVTNTGSYVYVTSSSQQEGSASKRVAASLSASCAAGSPCRRLRSSMSLAFVLVLQCLSVAGAFVVLIVVTSLMMDSTARALVEEGVAAELHYARARILAPINMYEKLLLSLRYNYMARKMLTGEEPCADTGDIADSVPFFMDGMAIIESNPMLSYVYHLRRSELHNYSNTSEAHIIECDATPIDVMIVGNVNRMTNRPVQLGDFANFTEAFEIESDDGTDYFSQDYVWQALGSQSFHWLPYTYYDDVYETADLLVAAYAPMTIRRTYDDGSTDTYAPVLAFRGEGVTAEEEGLTESTVTPTAGPDSSETNKTIVSTEVLSTIALEVSMSAFATLMRSVTPDDAGATTSLYDLSPDRARPSLVCTSVEGMRVFDSATEQEWPAGQTPSEAINRAYRIARPTPTRAASSSSSGTVVTLSEDFAKGDIVARIAYEDGYVVSTIPIETSSGITFAVVQATPEAYYLSTVWQLRTVMIAIGVVAAVFVVVVCVAIGVSIVVPLRKMQANMQLASSFKNEHVVPTSSFLSEIDLLCLSLDRMNAKLLQARAFMPQALLTSSGEDEGDVDAERNDDDDDSRYRNVVDLFDEDGINTARSNSQSAKDLPLYLDGGKRKYAAHRHGDAFDDATTDTTNTTVTTITATTGSVAVGSGHRGGNARGRQATSSENRRNLRQHQIVSILKKTGGASSPHHLGGGFRGTALELAAVGSSNASMVNKRVTVLAVNARGFHAKVSLSAPSTITALAADLTGLVVSVCAAERGVVDAFHGDHFVLTFNAAKHNAQGPTAAMRCAMDIIRRSKESLLESMSNEHAHALLLDASCSAFGPSLAMLNHPYSPSASSNITDGCAKPLAGPSSSELSNLFSMGASIGRACVGHLGTASMKRQSIVGKCYSKAMALEGLCRRMDRDRGRYKVRGESSAARATSPPPIQCLIDGPLATEVKHLYLLQLLGALCHAPFVDEDRKVSESFHGTNGKNPAAAAVPQMERLYALRDVIPDASHTASTSFATTRANFTGNSATIPGGAVDGQLKDSSASAMVALFERLANQHSSSIVGGGGGGLAGSVMRGENGGGEWLYETQRAAQQDPLLVNINECYGAYLKELMQVEFLSAVSDDHSSPPNAVESASDSLTAQFAERLRAIEARYNISDDSVPPVDPSDIPALASQSDNNQLLPQQSGRHQPPLYWGRIASAHVKATVLQSSRRLSTRDLVQCD